MQVPTNVYWDKLQFDAWTFHLAATDTGLCLITLPNETFDILEAWVTNHIPYSVLFHDKPKLNPYLEQIEEYLNGHRRAFFVPPHLKGTPFQVQVWRSLLEIPFGETRSYSQISGCIGSPSAVRAVGAAIAANPIPLVIPCHRVIGSSARMEISQGIGAVRT